MTDHAGDARATSTHAFDGTVQSASDGFFDLIGQPALPSDRSLVAFVHIDDLTATAGALLRASRDGTATVAHRLNTVDGPRWCSTTMLLAGDVVEWITRPTDDEAPVELDAALVRVRVDDGIIVDVNRTAEELLHAPPGSLNGRSVLDLVERADIARIVNEISALGDARPGATARFEVHTAGPDARAVRLDCIGIRASDADATIDVLVHVAGLGRRVGAPSGFHDRDELLHAVERSGGAVLAVRFEGLAEFSTAHSDDAERALLDAVAVRMRRQLPGAPIALVAPWTLAAVAPPGLDRDRLADLADHLRDVLAGAVTHEEDSIFPEPRISVGRAGEGVSASGLVAEAVAATASARIRPHVFVATSRRVAKAALLLRSELHHAIERDQLRLHYQPYVDARTGAPVGVEALVRWQHPTHGLLPPGQFMPAAEESGFIHPLGAWVFTQACRDLARLRNETARPLTMSVNVSPSQLADAYFTQRFEDIVAVSDIDGRDVCIEVTETVLMDFGGGAGRLLEDLRDRTGVRLAIDDFGTGHATLTYLRNLRVDVVKVDRSFVTNIVDSHVDRAIVDAIASLAHALGVEVTAEGIETPDQAAAVADAGCDLQQGYWIARPLPLDTLLEFLRVTNPGL